MFSEALLSPEFLKQLKLALGQLHRLSQIGHAGLRCIKGDLSRFGRLAGQLDLQAGEELFEGEWLDHIVIGTGLDRSSPLSSPIITSTMAA